MIIFWIIKITPVYDSVPSSISTASNKMDSCVRHSAFTEHLLCARRYSRRKQWQPTPVLLSGKSHGQRSLKGCSPWGREESDVTERLHFHFSLSCIGEGNGNPSSVLAWRIPGTGEPGGLPSLGLHRVGLD